MPDTIEMPEMDALYNRIEKKVDVDSQTQIFDFLRTHKTFDGRNPDGSPKFKLRAIPTTPNWNWKGQNRLAREIAEETERREKIDRARTLKTLKRLRTLASTTTSSKLAEERISGLETERETEFRTLSKSIFTMSETQLDALEIDRGFFGSRLANSLERAATQRRKELEEV